ncbi:DUF159-domain-containing protein [Tothia fuscella]|uniref:DUF159-domain-containing protein n=1 Tax=Tothia fuscella TaxID=1048955 RepID=A0A9P4NL10_9PEZI|nr:DUF159-domain-containing protein [Tothia fuscella]
MCGRYAFYQRPSEVRRQLEDSHMPCEDCPNDDVCRQTYNFPPGAFGIVYRAEVPDYGAGPSKREQEEADAENEQTEIAEEIKTKPATQHHVDVHYKLQAMKWGLIPAWTKRSPDYGSMMRTINCRDDSLIENRGMWNTMKKRKRCIVLCQGFYEWLKRPNSKEKIPHFVKRKDGQLMCFAGLWDCAKYEGSDEKHYTYTVITTDSNKQLKFLHDRMPVIFDNGSDEIRTWLDPNRYEWTKELQSLLKPYDGELECYPVNRDVGKVGNNSPSFVIPIDSAENKSNIANFFGNQKKLAKTQEAKKNLTKTEEDAETKGVKIEAETEETRATTESKSSENNAPLPGSPRGVKREHSDEENGHGEILPTQHKLPKIEPKSPSSSPAKPNPKMKSATSNGTKASPIKKKSEAGTQKITKFFGK